jgi:hypothetical protein
VGNLPCFCAQIDDLFLTTRLWEAATRANTGPAYAVSPDDFTWHRQYVNTALNNVRSETEWTCTTTPLARVVFLFSIPSKCNAGRVQWLPDGSNVRLAMAFNGAGRSITCVHFLSTLRVSYS